MKKIKIEKEILEKKYIEERKSFRTIAKELNCGKTTIETYIKKYNIPTRKNYEVRIGMKFPKGWREKISKNHARISGEDHPRYKNPVFGEKTGGWRGGKTELLSGIRSLTKYIDWRNSVFERDNYTCQNCGDNRGGNLNADHIKPLSLLIKENKIKTTKEAYGCEELWDISNGRTLCVSCHKKTDTWGHKSFLMTKDYRIDE